MTKILFVCLGNICRSPMAEFVMKDTIRRMGIEDKFYIESAATSTEAVGCSVHHGTRKILDRLNIKYDGKRARQMTKADYEEFDYIIVMEDANKRALEARLGKDTDEKIFKLLSFAGSGADIADPWYTGNFEDTYNDIVRGIDGLLKHLGVGM